MLFVIDCNKLITSFLNFLCSSTRTNIDALVRWDHDSTTNVVDVGELSYEGKIGIASRVVMMWQGTPWAGKVVAIDADDAEDDIPLAFFLDTSSM